MIRKIDLAPTPPQERFAEATPIGLLCLAIGCAALVPIAFGKGLTPAGLRTAAMYCLLFGAGGQMVAGLLSFANRNLYGGTLFTAFAFNWILNGWVLDSLARRPQTAPGLAQALGVAPGLLGNLLDDLSARGLVRPTRLGGPTFYLRGER